MKKLIAFSLALVLILGLAGCGDMAPVLDEVEQQLQNLEEIEDQLQELEEELDQYGEEQSSPEDAPGTEPSQEAEGESTQEAPIDENGWYYNAEDVALYLNTYGRLPGNFITKDEARKLGWEGGSVEKYAPGQAIGGDSFGNREGLLPEAEGRSYYECDIDTYGQDSRGAKRLVFSNDGLIYYTEDHYESFTLLYGEE